MFASLTLTAKQSRLFDDRFDPLRSSRQPRIEPANRIGKGAIRSRRPDVYQEILEPKQ
jgi:hypothetical protein